MTRFALVMLLACLAVATSCAPLHPPAPFAGQYSGAEEKTYRRGYQFGHEDGSRKREAEYERHHRDYTPATEKAFEHGYKLGFEAGEDQAKADDSDHARARMQGHDAGHSDSETGLSPFYQRHRRNYTQATESSFREGYVRGFNFARHDASPVELHRAR